MTAVAREYPARPWVGVGVIVWKDDTVLLVRRGRPPRLGEWSLPGGAQETGETVFDAAVREIAEETGLSIVPTGIVTVVDSIVPDDEGRIRYHYTIVEVEAEWRSGEPLCADDALEAQWAAVDSVGRLVPWGETERIVRLSHAQRDAKKGAVPKNGPNSSA